MTDDDLDTPMRMAAFEHVRRLGEVHDHLTADELKPGFVFEGERIPLVNPRRGIFKPRQMRYLLSIKTVYPRPGARVWYDDQRDVHRQIFEGDETVDYAFMRQDPEAADNRWLREAFENGIPVIYFLGIAPGFTGVAPCPDCPNSGCLTPRTSFPTRMKGWGSPSSRTASRSPRSSCRLRRPSDRHRSRLSAACI